MPTARWWERSGLREKDGGKTAACVKRKFLPETRFFYFSGNREAPGFVKPVYINGKKGAYES